MGIFLHPVVKDDALRKMLMAWYYAGMPTAISPFSEALISMLIIFSGYYTGLHEGQQLAQENSEKPSKG